MLAEDVHLGAGHRAVDLDQLDDVPLGVEVAVGQLLSYIDGAAVDDGAQMADVLGELCPGTSRSVGALPVAGREVRVDRRAHGQVGAEQEVSEGGCDGRRNQGCLLSKRACIPHA